MRIYRLRVVAAALCVASFASFGATNEVSAVTRRTTTKPKKKATTRKKTTTRKPVTTRPASSTTTLVAGATELDIRNAAIEDVYERYKALIIKIEENKTTTPVVPIDGKAILTGQAYLDVLGYEKAEIATGLYFVNVTFEGIDFRIESSSPTNATFRVCERLKTGGARKKSDNSPAVDPFPLVVNDRQYDMVYSPDAKRWFISLGGRFNDESGVSRCADGK
jgi:hypothetical protein